MSERCEHGLLSLQLLYLIPLSYLLKPYPCILSTKSETITESRVTVSSHAIYLLILHSQFDVHEKYCGPSKLALHSHLFISWAWD